MPNPPRILAGAMSGTSADGVDVAITRITGRGLEMQAELLHHHHREYDSKLRGSIFQLRERGRVELWELARLAREISMTYALAVNEALGGVNLKSNQIAAIAAHGQTLFHDPPNTIQWLDPSLLAAETGCPVVSDFRRADLAAGGQGAPLVPFADYILFRHPTKDRVLLNIGGIANITWLKAGGTLEEVIAFDTGPGNCISDYLCRKHDPTGPGFDHNGERAMRGQTLPDFFDAIWDHPFFELKPPKSTDAPQMIFAFEAAIRSHPNASLDDLLETAAKLCALSVINAIRQSFDTLPDEWIVSGGGTKNAAIMSYLEIAGGVPKELVTTTRMGVPEQAKEALAFALLGAATLDGEPSNVPSVTGARRAVVLGSITPRP